MLVRANYAPVHQYSEYWYVGKNKIGRPKLSVQVRPKVVELRDAVRRRELKKKDFYRLH